MGLPTRQGAPVAAQPSSSKATVLRTSAALTTSWVASGPIDIRDPRICALWVAYDGATSSTGGIAQIRVMVTGEDQVKTGTDAQKKIEEAPTVATDAWYAPAVIDATPTDAVLAGAGPTGATPTITPEWRSHKAGPQLVRTFALDTVTDNIRMVLPYRVDYARWLYIACRESGSATNPGTLGVKYNTSF